MPTKDELIDENATLRARVAELEAQVEGLAAQDGAAVRVRGADGQFAEPVEGAMYRYDGSGDMVEALAAGQPLRLEHDRYYWYTEGGGLSLVAQAPVGAMAEEVELLKAEVQRLGIVNGDLVSKLADARDRLRDAQTLHGSIDTLRPPY